MAIILRVSSGGFASKVWDDVAMRQLALTAAATVQARAFDRGVGSADQAHKPYSKPYAAWRKGKGYQVSPPNLTLTGRMRRSYRILSVGRDKATLGLAGRPAVYGQFVERLRPWMGTSEADRVIIRKALPGIVRDCIKRNGRSL